MIDKEVKQLQLCAANNTVKKPDVKRRSILKRMSSRYNKIEEPSTNSINKQVAFRLPVKAAKRNHKRTISNLNQLLQHRSVQALIAERAREIEPFVPRNIEVELSDTLRSFNLLVYGEPLIKCLLQQIQKSHHDA